MAYRNKTYVCFDADNDIRYYRLMTAWRQRDRSKFNFHDAHDINRILSTSNEQTIKRRLRERLSNSKIFVILVGRKTRYLHKYVSWEIDWALNNGLPIIAVNLHDNLRKIDELRCPPRVKQRLAVHISFNASILQHALENWSHYHYEMSKDGQSSPFFYEPEIYRGLGL